MTEGTEPLIAQVFAKLSDGQFHSGEELARELQVTRSAVWKTGRALKALGVTLHAVRNRGYRLADSGEALDADRIRSLLSAVAATRIRRIDARWMLSSTNTELLGRPNPPAGHGEALLAEYQTAGRGRRGRAWLAPPGGAICLSVSWGFSEVHRDLGALGLVIGVCALRTLVALGLQGAQLKWPNDLLVNDHKLGGILIELRAESSGPACVVIGIGLNLALGPVVLEQIRATGMAAVDLTTAGIKGVSRNIVAAGLISSLVKGLIEFESQGLKPFLSKWLEVDALHGRPVTVSGPEGPTKGIARGIDLDGSLLVETPQGLLKFISGDVSVRADT